MTDPRIHARRVTVARQAGRSRRRKLAAGALSIALAAGALALVHSPVFGARHVTVSGAAQVSPSAVIAAAGLADRPPLIDLDAARIAKRVERLPWVATAAVHIAWPWSVSIRLTQRVPVAVATVAGIGYAICDATGRVLELVPNRPASLPVIAVAGVGRPGTTLAGDGPELASVAAATPESMVGEIIDLTSSPQGIVVALHGGLEALIGSANDLTQKFISLATVLAHGGLAGVKVVDLRVPSAPVLIRQASGPIVYGNVGG